MTTALKKVSARQTVIWAYLDVVLANLTSAANKAVIQVPQNAIVVDGFVSVTEVFNSTSSDVIDVGDGSSSNRYKNNVDGQALGLTALVPTGYVYTAPTDLVVNWTSGGGTPTTGKFTVAVAYIVRGRGDLGNQGLDA